MDVVVWPGTAHAGVARSVSGHHVLRLRESPGSGADAVASKRLQPVDWRAGALEYIPPGADHSHRTDLASDWISVALATHEWDALVDLSRGSRPFTSLPHSSGQPGRRRTNTF